jgi:hypothetical protein
MTNCKAYLHEIVEVAEGRVLSRDARAHVESCRACGDSLREHESLRQLVGGLRKVEAPTDFEFRLRARMAASKTQVRRSPLDGLRALYGFAPVAVAACFLIISATLYLRMTPRTSPVNGSSESAVVEKTQSPVDVQSSAPPEQIVSNKQGLPVDSMNDRARGAIASIQSTGAPKQRVGVRQLRETLSRSEGNRVQASNMLTADLNSAPVITARTWKIPVGTPAEPLRMVVRDERGAERVVPMRTVSFGSQELIAREGARQHTALADNEGVW